MQSRHRITTVRLVAPAVLALSAACGRADLPTAQPSATASYARVPGPPPRVNSLRITDLSLASTTLAINGLATTYTATIAYDGPAKALLGVSAQAYIRQGSVSAAAGGTLVQCIPSLPGVVPQGTCTFSFTTSASNSSTAPGALLTRGPATFELRLYQSIGGGTTQLASRSLPVTLVPNAPYIESVALQTTNVFIGAPMPFTITFRNPTATTQSNLQFATAFTQGTLSRAGGGSMLNCGSDPDVSVGEMPALSSCTMQFTTQALGGVGFIEAPATWEVRLKQGVAGGASTLDATTVQVNLSFPIT
jgi:hypothetical protein